MVSNADLRHVRGVMIKNFQLQQFLGLASRHNRAFAEKIAKDKRGMALIIIVMTMTLLLSVIGAGLFSSARNFKTAGHHRTGTQAFYIADTGITHAAEELS